MSLDEVTNALLIERQRQRVMMNIIEMLAEQPDIPKCKEGGDLGGHGSPTYMRWGDEA